MKKTNDLTPYQNVLPYASEIFGVYQPLLGWRGKRTKGRVEKGFSNDLSRAFESLYRKFKGQFEMALNERMSLESIRRLEPAVLTASESRLGGSFVMEAIARKLPPIEEYSDSVWDQAVQPARIQDTLQTVVIPETMKWYKAAASQGAEPAATAKRGASINATVAAQSASLFQFFFSHE